jgi:hypothetical protein
MSALDPLTDPLSIGNLAISRGYATAEQIAEALCEQQERLPLGEILVSNDVITVDQLDELLHLQDVARAPSPSAVTILELERQERKARETTASLQNVTAACHRFVANGKF